MTQIRGFYRYQCTIKCILYMRLSTFVYLHCDFSLDPLFCVILHILRGPGLLTRTRTRPEFSSGPCDLRNLKEDRHTIPKMYSYMRFGGP